MPLMIVFAGGTVGMVSRVKTTGFCRQANCFCLTAGILTLSDLRSNLYCALMGLLTSDIKAFAKIRSAFKISKQKLLIAWNANQAVDLP